MKLYINPQSPNSRLAQLVAAHVGSNADVEIVDMQSGAHKTPEFLQINPNGKVPALEDGDLKLWESNAIACYLASQADSDIWPKSNDRYDIMRWQHWQSAHWNPAMSKFLAEFIFKSEPDAENVAAAKENFTRWASVLNNHLEANQWVCGDQMTIADFSLAAPLMYAEPCQIPVADFPHVAAWFGRVQETDAWKSTSN